MRFLGTRQPAEWRDGDMIYPAYTYCPADTVLQQMECREYDPDPATWGCTHCQSGMSDECDLEVSG